MPGLWTATRAAVSAFRRGMFGYDAAVSSPRRKAPSVTQRSEDAELPAGKRAAIVSTSRDLPRNFAIARWAINKHLDYVSKFTFQSRTPDVGLNKDVEDLMKRDSTKERCDAAGRHPFRRMLRLSEARATIDGDIGLVMMADGTLAALEGDRIRDPAGAGNAGGGMALAAGQRIEQGVIVNAAGKALGYAVHNRGVGGTNFVFDRIVPSEYVILHAYYDRFDQVRGISPLACALNPFRDVYENIDFALAKAKVSQLFGVKFKREDPDDGQMPASTRDESEGDGEETEDTDAEGSRYPVDFGKGPFLLDLDPGDDADVLESKNTASADFQAFMSGVIMVALKAVDIPLSFYDESHTSWSGQRQAWIQYDDSASTKRENLRDVANQITYWRYARWIAAGELILPRQLTLDDLRWEWVSAGVPWIDMLKEAQANIQNLRAGLTSRTRILKQQQVEFTDVVDEIAAEEQLLRDKKVTLPDFVPVPIVEESEPKKGSKDASRQAA